MRRSTTHKIQIDTNGGVADDMNDQILSNFSQNDAYNLCLSNIKTNGISNSLPLISITEPNDNGQDFKNVSNWSIEMKKSEEHSNKSESFNLSKHS